MFTEPLGLVEWNTELNFSSVQQILQLCHKHVWFMLPVYMVCGSGEDIKTGRLELNYCISAHWGSSVSNAVGNGISRSHSLIGIHR